MQQVIASLTFDSRLQPLAVRSAVAEMIELSFEADGIEIEMQCTPASDDHDRWDVMGQVSSASEPKRIALYSPESGEVIVDAVVDSRGMFQMQCQPGAFALVIEVDDSAVRTPMFELK